MKIEPMTPDHILKINGQENQPETLGMTPREYANHLMRLGPALVALDGDDVIFCGGSAQLWPDRHMLWAVVSKEAGKHMLKIVKAARRFISTHSGRVEAAVITDFTEGHRFVKMCGLRWHHHEEKFFPGGVDADVYVRFI